MYRVNEKNNNTMLNIYLIKGFAYINYMLKENKTVINRTKGFKVSVNPCDIKIRQMGRSLTILAKYASKQGHVMSIISCKRLINCNNGY